MCFQGVKICLVLPALRASQAEAHERRVAFDNADKAAARSEPLTVSSWTDEEAVGALSILDCMSVVVDWSYAAASNPAAAGAAGRRRALSVS